MKPRILTALRQKEPLNPQVFEDRQDYSLNLYEINEQFQGERLENLPQSVKYA